MGVPKRTYRQTARAEATQELRHRIVMVFHDLLLVRWMDEITLDEVATSAGTTRQTIIRLFGNKEGLLRPVTEIVLAKSVPRHAVPRNASIKTIVEGLVAHYEAAGDITLRLLAQEQRHPDLRSTLQIGRRKHRTWVEDRLGDELDDMGNLEWQRQITRLVVATDVYTWKLLRRDLGHSDAEVALLIAGMIRSILREGRP